MGIKEKFEASGKADARFVSLEIAHRNFIRFGERVLVKKLVDSNYFGILKELLDINPEFQIEQDSEADIPCVKGEVKIRDSVECLQLLVSSPSMRRRRARALSRYNNEDRKTLTLSVDIDGKDTASEIILLSELPNESKLSEAIYSVLRVSGLEDNIPRRIIAAEDDPYGYYAVLRLHPFAFRGLTDEEAEELIKRTWRFASNKAHPDRGGANEDMKKVNVARDFFMDPKNRKR